MLEIRPIQDGDMKYVRANPFEDAVKIYPDLPAPDSSFTCIFEGEIVAVGGVIVFWEGVGEVWLIMTKQARKKGIFGLIALSTIKKKVDNLIIENNLWRAQADVRADFPEAIKMVEAFGFEYEGTKRKYTPDGCNMKMYAKLL